MNLKQSLQRIRMGFVAPWFTELLGGVFLISGASWLLAPSLNPILNPVTNLVSDFESLGMPYAWLFRSFDVMAASALIMGVYLRRKAIRQQYSTLFYHGLHVVGILMATDAIVALRCIVNQGICSPIGNWYFYIHATESFALGVLLLVLTLYAWIKYKKWWWIVIIQLLCITVGFVLRIQHVHGLLAVQAFNQLAIVYWLYCLVFTIHHPIVSTTSAKSRTIIATFVALNGVILLWSSWHRVVIYPLLDDILFANDYSWLVGHSVLGGLALLYLARQLYTGRRVARVIVLIILLTETIKYALIWQKPVLAIVFGLSLFYLAMQARNFDLPSSGDSFRQRLQIILVGLFVLAAIIFTFSFSYLKLNPDSWRESAFDTVRVIKRTLLLEYSTDKHDSRSARALGYSLNAFGVGVYVLLGFGLFLPYKKPQYSRAQYANKQLMADQLSHWSASSEDVFKLWPEDKLYWRSTRNVVVAYAVSGNKAVAISEPIGNIKYCDQAKQEFQVFCRSHGWQCVWIMIDEKNIDFYVKNNYRTLHIGSSAIVDIGEFNENTIRDKWWRWVINRQTKAGLVYSYKIAPQKQVVLVAIQQISDEWKQRKNHQERGFLLGYFDRAMIRDCNLYTVHDAHGTIIAFANELPQLRPLKRATIDLMRSTTGHDGTMAYLLAKAINHAGQRGFTEFDLGFVPLAPNTNASKKQLLMQQALSPFFSARGLNQFKNKFKPRWERSYVAWDGDMLDIPAVALALNSLLNSISKDIVDSGGVM